MKLKLPTISARVKAVGLVVLGVVLTPVILSFAWLAMIFMIGWALYLHFKLNEERQQWTSRPTHA